MSESICPAPGSSASRRTRIRNCLLTAYGLSRADTDAVDDGHDPEGHFISLDPGIELRPPVAANIEEALQDVFGQALAARYPDHPEFGVEVRRPALRRVLEVVERAVVHPEERVEVDRRARDDVRHIAVPLQLGEMGELHFKLGRRWPDELDRKRAQHGGDTLSAGELRAWIEAPERRGLDRDVQNLVILTFALQKGLSFTLRGQPASAAIETLDDGLVLEAQALPDAGDWERATELSNAVFGIEASRLMNAQNVAGLAQALRGAAGEPHREAAGALADSLRTRLDARGIHAANADRFRTASATLSLLSALDRAEGRLSHLKAEAFAERSSVPPSGLRGRLARFAAAATAAIDAPDALESAERAFRRIREHVACDDQGVCDPSLPDAPSLAREPHGAAPARACDALHGREDAGPGHAEDPARRHDPAASRLGRASGVIVAWGVSIRRPCDNARSDLRQEQGTCRARHIPIAYRVRTLRSMAAYRPARETSIRIEPGGTVSQ